MINKYIWQNYINSEGKDVVSFFKEALLNGNFDNFPEKISQLHKVYNPSKYINEDLNKELIETVSAICDGEYIFEPGEYTIYSAMNYLYKKFFVDDSCTAKSAFSNFSYNIVLFSSICSFELNELFIPYYFTYNFNILEKIADEFGIILPELPVKKDYKGRFFYYGKICEALYDFRIENDMSPYELCAFLYDFAPKYIGGVNSYIIKDLPEPKGAYFIGGTRDDAFLSDDEDLITPWQCNPETLAGDNVVMYLKTPISAVDSIWRSVSVGFNDPFFYYYRCTYIAKPQKINRISKCELEKDELFKDLPIVRKNLQGINGVELYPSVYNHLLDMAKSDLPKFNYADNIDNCELFREKDVENKLIKPFLKKLGYNENEYVQQLYIEIGNHNHALIPDFVIHPNVTKGHHSAEFLIEAKYSVKSEKDLEEYKNQARSYANQLKVKYSVVASKEGIWVSSETDDFSRDFIAMSWEELNIEDNFYRVFKFLGNGNIEKSSKLKTKLSNRESEYKMFSDND